MYTLFCSHALLAIGYLLLYFLRGSLPWQGVRAGNKHEKYQKIMEKKMSTPEEVLSDGYPCKASAR